MRMQVPQNGAEKWEFCDSVIYDARSAPEIHRKESLAHMGHEDFPCGLSRRLASHPKPNALECLLQGVNIAEKSHHKSGEKTPSQSARQIKTKSKGTDECEGEYRGKPQIKGIPRLID